MTTPTPSLRERFEQFEAEYIKFERIEHKLSSRTDLHAFLLLNSLQPGTGDMISASEHDEFWLDINCEQLAAVITDEQIRDLVRCGVRYDEDLDSLCMFS